MKKIFKIEKIVTLIFLVIVVLSSCTNDLDITPKDDQDLLGEEFFADETAYQRLLAGVYANLSLTGVDGAGSSNIQGLDAGTSQFGRVLLYLQTLSADQMIWSYENDPGTREIQRNIWNADDPIVLHSDLPWLTIPHDCPFQLSDLVLKRLFGQHQKLYSNGVR